MDCQETGSGILWEFKSTLSNASGFNADALVDLVGNDETYKRFMYCGIHPNLLI